jgi:hypothetical protein
MPRMEIIHTVFFVVLFVVLILVFFASIKFLFVPPDENGWLHVDLDALAEKRGSWAVLLLIATMVLGD